MAEDQSSGDNEQIMDAEIVDENQAIDERIINQNLLTTTVVPMELDYDLKNSDNRNLRRHNILYTQILKQYVNNFKDTSEKKKKYQEPIINILIIMMVGLPIDIIAFLYYVMENYSGMENLPVLISGTLTALVSFVTAIIALPKIIIRYLFNEKEEEHMTSIIKNIQDYDKQIRLNKDKQDEDN